MMGQRQPPPASDMPGLAVSTSPLDVVAHVIQVALTPVFLLSGIATLLECILDAPRAGGRFDHQSDRGQRR